MSEGLVVDGHAHVWMLDGDEYPWRPAFGYVPDAEAAPEALLAEMDRCGVTRTVLVQPSVYGPDHRFLLDTVRRHPNRFVPVGLVDPVEPELADLAVSLVREDGCAGLRVNLSLDVGRAATQAGAPGWADLEGLGVPICLRAAPAHHELVVQILSRHPGVRLVVDHLGLPDPKATELAIAQLRELARFPNCLLKVAGLARLSGAEPPYRDLWPVVQAALESFGAERMLWGSDFPLGQSDGAYPAAIEAIRGMPFVNQADRHSLLAGTSSEVWPQVSSEPRGAIA